MNGFGVVLQALREELDRGVNIQGVQFLRDIAEGQSGLKQGMRGDEALKGMTNYLRLIDVGSIRCRDTQRIRADSDHAERDGELQSP